LSRVFFVRRCGGIVPGYYEGTSADGGNPGTGYSVSGATLTLYSGSPSSDNTMGVMYLSEHAQ
jgi:hypothetical protein